MVFLTTPPRQFASCFGRVWKRQWRRHSSSQSRKPPAPHALSPQKMRALISLYHQSETFITPENLSERIDQAFTGEKTGNLAFRSQPGIDTLSTFYNEAKSAPKFSEWDREKIKFGHGVWSQATYSRREWKVIEALYGVDASGSLEPLPGLEALEEGDEGNIGLPPSEVVVDE
ncbi:MAG: hypothetical protein NXY57DRAFT_906169 [Lentinula lateritia]|nr:MAG: hypothetical protein NXY57DRAFT_906169 [Lentinula lateritia]